MTAKALYHSIVDDRPIFIDINGTLTDTTERGGEPIEARIGKLNAFIEQGGFDPGGSQVYSKEAVQDGLAGFVVRLYDFVVKHKRLLFQELSTLAHLRRVNEAATVAYDAGCRFAEAKGK